MFPKKSVNLGDLVLAISGVLDIGFSTLALHQQRTASIAWELGKQANLEGKRIENIFLACLFHDIGALSIEEKKSLHDNETTEVNHHCIRGQRLFKSNPWFAPCADLVRYHHKAWNMWEEPRDTPEVFDSQILFFADYLERHIDRKTFILHQDEALCRRMKALAGKQIQNEIFELFLDLSRREEFWLNVTSPHLNSLLLKHGPFQAIEVDIDSIVIFAKLIGSIIDFKSPFTVTHTSGVAQCSILLAEMSGMSESEVNLMEAAGLLHDLGKLVIPNSILDKPAGLTHAERAMIKQHSYHTFSVLGTIGGLQTIAEWAGYHHERLDGNGYPFRREEHEIDLGARIVAVSDIFTSLTEDRPYRKGMNAESIKTIIQDQSSHGMQDSRIVNLLFDNVKEISMAVKERQEQARYFYQAKVEKF